MKLVVDTHVHSISSGHAYSTVQEIAVRANEKGIKVFALTDHGPNMLGASGLFHFANLKVLPDYIEGVRVIRGAEVNIIDYEGILDIPDRYLKSLEFVLVSLHDVTIEPSTQKDNTNAIINALKNPYVDAVAHPGNPEFDIDIEEVVKACVEYNKCVEINNHSFVGRKGSYPNCKKFLQLCKQYKVRIVCGSDTHYSENIGNFEHVLDLINEVGMPEEFILNTSEDKFMKYLLERKSRIINAFSK